jgi:hypothetical protein
VSRRDPNTVDLALVVMVAEAIIEAVTDAPEGVPAGWVYAALMDLVTFEQFCEMVAGLVGAERIRRDGDLLLPC